MQRAAPPPLTRLPRLLATREHIKRYDLFAVRLLAPLDRSQQQAVSPSLLDAAHGTRINGGRARRPALAKAAAPLIAALRVRVQLAHLIKPAATCARLHVALDQGAGHGFAKQQPLRLGLEQRLHFARRGGTRVLATFQLRARRTS